MAGWCITVTENEGIWKCGAHQLAPHLWSERTTSNVHLNGTYQYLYKNSFDDNLGELRPRNGSLDA
jgi:hypothetical protein